MEKVKNGIKLWISKLKEMWITMVISCGVWTVLVFLWEKGVRGFLFSLLNFLTGALLSVDGQNVLGGVIGRTFILIVFNTFISSLLIHKGKFKTRFAFAKADFKSGLENLSEYVSSFSLFATKQKDVIFAGVLGVGLSIIWNAFISGNGYLVNTFPCIALFIILLEQFETKSGFFVAVVNLVARKLGYENICGDAVLAFIEAFMAGCLLMPIFAFLGLSDAAYAIGVIVAIVGVVGLFWSKEILKKSAAMFFIILLLVPATQVKAGGMDFFTTLSQGSIEREENGQVYTTTITDVVVNGESHTEETVELYPGDKCSFVVRTNDYRFIATGVKVTCPNCGEQNYHHYEYPQANGGYNRYLQDGFSGEFIFENIDIYADGITGELRGKISANYFNYADEEGYWEACPKCSSDSYNEILQGTFMVSGQGRTEIEFTGAKIGALYGFDDSEYFIMEIANPMDDLEVRVSWDNQISEVYNNSEGIFVTFVESELSKQILYGEEERYYPEPSPDYNTPDSNNNHHNNDDFGMSEEEYLEMQERGESVPVNTAVAVVASVAAAGAVATFTAPLTSVVESAAGMKKKKGQLVVNGDADVPTIHYNDHENIMIPVNVTDGDDVVWAITAIAITPDDEKLVKAIAIPTSTTSAEIKLEIQRAPKENVTTYIEVTTLGVELTGEHYFHETMVEVNIEP